MDHGPFDIGGREPRMKAILSLAVMLCIAPVLHSAPSENVNTPALPHTTLTLTQPVAAGGFTPQIGRGTEAFKSLPAFCRVAATITPVPDSEIKIEVWLPESGWNGK